MPYEILLGLKLVTASDTNTTPLVLQENEDVSCVYMCVTVCLYGYLSIYLYEQ